jgi:2-hydroxy-6-oxonona-2,4-dienedioate hydrolase
MSSKPTPHQPTSIRRRPSLTALGAGAVTSAGVGVYSAWLRSLRLQLAARSRVIATPYGRLEYAQEWSGPPILVAHGILGGWDQGMLVTELAPPDERNLHVITVSRWGYLRTPIPRIPAHRTFEAQADSYVTLLDTLGIDRVAMVGISGGTPSAILFALRHPDRVWALVSVAGVTGPIVPNFTIRDHAMIAVANNDLALLTLRTFAKKYLMAFYGGRRARLDTFKSQPEKQRVLEALYFPHPLTLRRKGFAHDMALFPTLPRYPVERITVPTLAVHGTADATVPIAHSRFLVDNVRGARLLPVEGGGHLAIATHKEVALSGVYHFLQEHAPSYPNG